MSQWTTERVLALAPDASSLSSARELSSEAKWPSSGTQNHALWGEAKGSGAKPYQTAVDLREPAFKCSCPSRKFPCKHALGLMIRYAKGEIMAAAPPGWVTEWLEKRDEKSTKQETKSDAPKTEIDVEAAAKRSNKRWENILAGLEECEAFLADAAGQGLLASQSARSWDHMAARMIDAQSPGIARRLRQIGLTIGVGPDWGRTVADQMGNLSLLMEASRRVESLNEDARADLRAALGIPQKKDDVELAPVADVWDVLGQVIEQEDRITACRSWLLGRGTGRWAMHLAFSVAGRPFDIRLLPGTAFVAELAFFPSAWPLRAHLDDAISEPFSPRIGATWDASLDRLSHAMAAQPWIEQFPVHLTGARFGTDGQAWWVVDQNGQSGKLRGPLPWPVLALSGNAPAEVIGEWDGSSLRLMAAWGPWGFVSL